MLWNLPFTFAQYLSSTKPRLQNKRVVKRFSGRNKTAWDLFCCLNSGIIQISVWHCMIPYRYDRTAIVILMMRSWSRFVFFYKNIIFRHLVRLGTFQLCRMWHRWAEFSDLSQTSWFLIGSFLSLNYTLTVNLIQEHSETEKRIETRKCLPPDLFS